MKKSLLILSMMAVAATATAFEKPEAGTTDKPNYYVITANRGVPYLGYTAEGITTKITGKTTNLYRTNELTTANVWAVTPGATDGTVVIKNYTADAYLMSFFSASVASTTTADAVAGTVSEPTDLVLKDMGGAYAISLTSDAEPNYPDNCISLDAVGGDAVTCGNYVPTSAEGAEGGCWWFTKVTPADGQSMADALAAVQQTMLEDEVKATVEEYTAWLETFSSNVPQVKEQIQAGIDQLKALPATEDYATKITEIVDAAFAEADKALATAFSNGTYAIFNPRRANTAGTTEGAYLAVNAANNKYAGSISHAANNTRFTFTAKDNGYLIYNPDTKKYIGTTTITKEDGKTTQVVCTPVDEAAAQVFQVVLNESGNYVGVALVSDAATGNGINWQSWNDGVVSIYSINDEGSVFSIKVADDDAAVAEVAAAVESALTPYIANVPASVKTILEKAIADAKALPFSSDIADKAEAIRAKAIEDANAALATGLNGIVYTLKYVRGGDFVNYVNNNFLHANESTAATAESTRFTFKAAANGGYTIYNAAAQIYVGPTDAATTSNTLTSVSEEASAVVVYPVLMKSGAYSGIALCFSADHSGDGVNMNAGDGICSYSVADEGSIWGLLDPSTLAGIESVPVADKVAIEGIYDLSGRRLSAPVRGINIINGKKVFVR